MKNHIQSLVRKNIRELVPYSSARDEYYGEEAVFLDANENPFNQPYNRYPDPHQRKLKNKISWLKGIPTDNIFLGNGSDEAIDLLFRIFCEPGRDEMVTMAPSYGMFSVAARVNDVSVTEALLNTDFSLDSGKILDAVNPATRMIFLCSPNNPAANLLEEKAIVEILESFDGIVVLDEAYIDFADDPGWLSRLNGFEKLVVLQTFSKAWGMAGLRLGMAFADPDIIGYMDKVKYPYNVNTQTQAIVFDAIANRGKMEQYRDRIIEEREELSKTLGSFSFVQKVFDSQANFLLVRVQDPDDLYRHLANDSLIVRNRSRLPLCEGCLRITVGTPEENRSLIRSMEKYKA